jgi:hypothetical protein
MTQKYLKRLPFENSKLRIINPIRKHIKKTGKNNANPEIAKTGGSGQRVLISMGNPHSDILVMIFHTTGIARRACGH